MVELSILFKINYFWLLEKNPLRLPLMDLHRQGKLMLKGTLVMFWVTLSMKQTALKVAMLDSSVCVCVCDGLLATDSGLTLAFIYL